MVASGTHSYELPPWQRGWYLLPTVPEGCDFPPNTCFETSTMLICFMLFGKFLEASAKGKASQAAPKTQPPPVDLNAAVSYLSLLCPQAVSKLLALQPETAQLCEGGRVGGEVREVESSTLRDGDVVQAPPATLY